MEDKLANLLIGLIFIIVLILGGMFAYKIFIEQPKPVAVKNEESINLISTTENNTKLEENESIVNSNVKIPLVESKISNQNIEITQEDMIYHNNRFYYNQLNNYSKVMYDAVFDNIEYLKQGNYQITLDYDFSSILNKNDENKTINNYYNEAINALNLDVANLFYIDFVKMSLSIETATSILGTKYKLTIGSGNNSNYLHNSFSSQVEIEKAISDLVDKKNQVIDSAIGDTYNKIALMHDWLIEHMQYDSSDTNKNTIYGAFINRRAICEGYARTFKYLLDELGINNVLIVGTAQNSSGTTEEHMWNYVKINDKWYAVDCTWDDPILANGVGTISYEAKHKYFLIGSDKLFKTHKEKNNIASNDKIFVLPTLSNVDY